MAKEDKAWDVHVQAEAYRLVAPTEAEAKARALRQRADGYLTEVVNVLAEPVEDE